MSITAEQLRAARAILRLEQSKVARATGVSVETIKRLEKMDGYLKASYEILSKLTSFFEENGIEFIEYGEMVSGGGPGVRMSMSRKEKIETSLDHVFQQYIYYAMAKVLPHLVLSGDDISDLYIAVDRMHEFIIEVKEDIKRDARKYYNNEIPPPLPYQNNKPGS